MTYPTRKQAKEFFTTKFFDEGQLFHAFNIAESAQKIANKCGLNEEKAYVLGLLHDCGYTKEGTQPDFHGKVGYEEMQKLCYDEVAKICLTHSFPNKDLRGGNYKQEWLNWVEAKLQEVEYDDYDRMIQLCDMFFGDFNKFSIKQRIADIARRHNISEEKQQILEKNGYELKTYFDSKCGCDIYELLGIRE